MDKKKVVQKALNAGFLISPNTLEKLDDNNIEAAIQGTKSVVIEEIKTDVKTTELDVSFKKTRTKKKLTIHDFVKYYNNVYDNLKNILLKKIEATSINKVANITSEVSVIGMVKEITSQGFVLEDPTGQIVVISNEIPEHNNVVAVTGVVREKKLFKKSINYPDVPLPKVIPKIDVKLLTTTSKDIPEGYDLIISTEKDNKDKNIYKMNSNPSWIKIKKGETKITMLIYRTNVTIDENSFNSYIKTRILPSKNNTPNEDVLIDAIPDIIWIIQDQEWTRNYKGITVFSSNTTTSIDLNSREVKFV